MINEIKVKRYCKDYQLIENYQQAVNDDSQTWECHHRNEIIENKSRQQLKEEGRYYDVSPDELIFLTKVEHLSIHNKGKQLSAETKRKLSKINKGRQLSDEHKQKISESLKGRQLSDEHKQKISENRSPYSGSPKKQVQCVETGEVFESLTDAAKKYNLLRCNIANCCNGKRQSCGGLHWCFVL